MEWNHDCDLNLLQEIVVSQPYKFKASTRERGKVWEGITEKLNATSLFNNRLGNKRAVRDRYALLAKKYKRKMAEEKRASGISPLMTDTDKRLEEIVEMFEESDRENGENLQQVEQNKENERKKAEEMRNRSMEKLGESMKRKAADEEGQVTPKERRSGSETFLYLKEKAEKEFELRKQELEVKKIEQSQQMQMFQYLQQQQQQQMQMHIQQQQLQNQMLMALIEKIAK